MNLVALCGILLLQGLFGNFTARQQPFPESISIEGTKLILNGYGTREAWWVDLYKIALYLPQRSSELGYIKQKDVPKVIRVSIAYGGSTPDKIPENWRRELFPVLEPGAERQLKSAYKSLKEGDRIVIQYLPSKGTTVFLNERKILAGDHILMEQFLDIWLGPKAVSENIKRLLLA